MKPLEPDNMAETAKEETSQPPRRHLWQWVVCLVAGAVLALALVWYAFHVDQRIQVERRLAALGTLRGPSSRPTWLDRLGVRSRLSLPTRPVDFSSSRITDDEMAYVSKLSSLTRVALRRAPVTDAGLEHLTELTKLENLILTNMHITDAGLKHIGKLTSLEQLYLADTEVTDAGLVHLLGLKRLQVLSLVLTQITDKGLPHIGKLKNLQTLHLSDTKITDEGLEHLKLIENLKQISLSRTRVSPTAIDELQQARPNLKIVYYQQPIGYQPGENPQ